MSKTGKVYIIGAGPGDPELITVKGMKALKKADCLLYDFLSSQELLKKTKKSCKQICVGKEDGLHLKEQAQTNQLLYEKAREFKTVVRLKGGDPFVFSRGIEEARYLDAKGIDFEVIPGVTSALAAPVSFGIPLTIKDKITSLAIVTGRRKNPDAEIEAPKAGTLVYLMGVANVANIVKALYKARRSPDTPCAFIERATTKKARIIRGRLRSIEAKVKEHKVRPPAVLVVGEVLGENQS